MVSIESELRRLVEDLSIRIRLLEQERAELSGLVGLLQKENAELKKKSAEDAAEIEDLRRYYDIAYGVRDDGIVLTNLKTINQGTIKAGGGEGSGGNAGGGGGGGY